MKRKHANSVRAIALLIVIGGVLFGFAVILCGSIFGAAAPDQLQPDEVISPTAFQNGKIAFSSNPLTFESTYEIYVMDSNGANKTQLTFRGSSMVDSAKPKWSADGTKIVFQKQFFIPPTFPPNSYVCTMNANGSNQTSLTPGSGSTLDSSPAWSPDGTKIVFVTARDGNGEIYVMDASGANPTNLTHNAAGDDSPAWSPDGNQIAFTSTRDGNPEIYVMNADGSNQTRLTNNGAADGSAGWSPDGSKITFTSQRDGNSEIYVMDSNGANQINLTVNSATDIDPAWSPDGTKILFTSTRDGNMEIYSMNTDGSNPTRITNNTLPDRQANWQPIFVSSTPTPTTTPTPTATPTSTPSPTPTIPPPTPSPTATPAPGSTPVVSAPIFSMNTSDGFAVNDQVVTTTFVDSSLGYIGFQGDIIFDSAVAAPTPTNHCMDPAGITAGNGWVVSGNVLNTGPGTLKTLRVSAFSIDETPLSGAGALYVIHWKRVSSVSGATSQLNWGSGAAVLDFEFIDTDLVNHSPPQNNGMITITGISPTPPPALSLTPTSFNFGSVEVGQNSVEKQFALGCGALPFGCPDVSISLSGPDAANFSMTFDDCSGRSLESGGVCFVRVRFNPVMTGLRSANLVGNAACSCSAAGAPLSGTGLLGPTPSPTPISVSGRVQYCPTSGAVPNTTLTITAGASSSSALSNGAGAYQVFLAPNGGYTVTPSKTSLVPGDPGINTVDVVAVQRHALNVVALPPGCRLTAADVNGDALINTVDVIAIQRFVLNMTTGIANVGKYQFAPASRNYNPLLVPQTEQDYDTLIFGDVAAPFVSP